MTEPNQSVMQIGKTIGLLAVLILLGFICSAKVAFVVTVEEPVHKKTIATWDCSGCHETRRVLPPGHVQTGRMTLGDCSHCHSSPENTLRSRIPLSHAHHLSGISCADCHADPEHAKPLRTQDCLACHGSAAKVAALTEKLSPNPHDSIHYGLYMDCDVCHNVHRESENFCNQCHYFDFLVL